jgi:hypothetical protein
MKSNTEKLLMFLRVLAWIAFIGLCIKSGAILLSYLVSIGNAMAAKNLYDNFDLSVYRELGLANYSVIVGYHLVLTIAQAYIAFLVTMLFTKMNISRPFNPEVVNLMQRISYCIVIVWAVAVVNNIHVSILEKRMGVPAINISVDSIFLAGIVYVLAQMFKRGVEIQSENELTV